MTGAYEFVCEKRSTDELSARLQELGPWIWRIGDSYWYGYYLACVPFPGVHIRICDVPTLADDGFRHKADVRRSPNAAKETIDEAFRRVLAQVPAHNVNEIEWFDYPAECC